MVSQNWMDELLRQRLAKTQGQKDARKLEEVKKGHAPRAAFERFCTEMETAVPQFNEKNTDQELGQFRCERRGTDAIAVVRSVRNTESGQVTVSLRREPLSLAILHQPGGPESSDAIELRPNIDGAVYFHLEGHQVSLSRAVEHVFSKFVLAIEV